MNAEDREIIVRPDALAVLGRQPSLQPEEADGSASSQPVRVGPPQANGDRDGHRLGLISDKELKYLVTAQFEYPPLRQGAGGYSEELVAAFNPYSGKGRSLRYLAARILLEAYSKEGLCFSVAGAHPACGATYIAANLGVVFSELGLRTLVIDANLKRPRLHTVFNWPQDGGLATMIAGKASPSSYVAPLGQFRDLSFLPAGRRAVRMSARLGNGVLANTLAALRQVYDVVICDAPAAAGKGSDGCEVVAGMCGNTVTVFRKHHTGVGRARHLLQTLDTVGTRQIGSVLSDY